MSEPTGLYGDDELIEFTEETEHSHGQYLAEFVEKVLPMFTRNGFSRDTALLYWVLTKIENKLDSVIEGREM